MSEDRANPIADARAQRNADMTNSGRGNVDPNAPGNPHVGGPPTNAQTPSFWDILAGLFSGGNDTPARPAEPNTAAPAQPQAPTAGQGENPMNTARRAFTGQPEAPSFWDRLANALGLGDGPSPSDLVRRDGADTQVAHGGAPAQPQAPASPGAALAQSPRPLVEPGGEIEVSELAPPIEVASAPGSAPATPHQNTLSGGAGREA